MPESKEQKKKRLEEELAELSEEKEHLKEKESRDRVESKEAEKAGDKETAKELTTQANHVAADAASVQTLIELSQALLKKLGTTDEEIKEIKARAKPRNRY